MEGEKSQQFRLSESASKLKGGLLFGCIWLNAEVARTTWNVDIVLERHGGAGGAVFPLRVLVAGSTSVWEKLKMSLGLLGLALGAKLLDSPVDAHPRGLVLVCPQGTRHHLAFRRLADLSQSQSRPPGRPE